MTEYPDKFLVTTWHRARASGARLSRPTPLSPEQSLL